MIKGNNESIRDYLFTENLWSTHFGNPRCESIQNKQWKYIRYYKNENIYSKNVKVIAKDHNINLTKLLYGNQDPQIAVYEELYHLKTDPKEKNNLKNNLDYNKELKIMRLAWREKINYARGEGKAKILRYTIDSKSEKGNISMPE